MKTLVVTGAGRGIGLCIASAWLGTGGNVVLVESDGTLERPALERLNGGARARFVSGDVSREAVVQDVMARAIEHFGRIDAVVHNAAVSDNRPVQALSYQDWHRVMDTNLSAAFLCAKHAAAALRESRGAMVFIASSRAIMSEPNTEAYSASKAGLVGLAHALAMSLAPVRVNCVSPGWIVTDGWQHGDARTELTAEDQAQHPVGRVGEPEDVAAMVLHLCSPQAGFITGQNFVVDGGMTRKMIYC